jgi:tetratricopeptide (TPR) repeat protein
LLSAAVSILPSDESREFVMAIRVSIRFVSFAFVSAMSFAQRKSADPIVSLADLCHTVTRTTLKEARAADKALKKNDFPEVIDHLEKVVKIDPEYVAARRNLSLAYLKTLQLEKAIRSFEILAELDPHAPLSYSGLSVTYLKLKRLADSEAAARRALELNSSYELGHFLLGTTLAAEDKDRQQALRHLARAIKRFPVAYVTAAGILARQGHRQEARVQLQAYLDSGDTASRAEVKALLNNLY